VVLETASIIIAHTWDADLQIQLVSPNNVVVDLSIENGSSGDNYGDPTDCPNSVTTFDMNAATGIAAGTAPFIGSYIPEGDFADFNDGSDPNGLWRLRVCDDAGGDLGTIEYVELVFASPAACPPPSGLYVDGITTTTAVAHWTIGGVPLTNIAWGAPGFDPDVDPIGTDTYNHPSALYTIGSVTPLNPMTNYEVYVQTDCGTDAVSAWVGPVAFMTACGTITAPFNEPFATTSIPNCWTMSGPEPWLFNTGAAYGAAAAGDHTPGGGTNYAWVDGSAGNNNGVILTSPLVDVSGLANPYLQFFYFSDNTNNPGDNNTITANFWDGAAWNILPGFPYAADDPNWVEFTFDLSGFTITGDVQVEFVVDQTAGTAFYNDQLIDDVKFYNVFPDDVSTISLDFNGFYATPGSFNPMVTVKNEGTNTQTFNVDLTITDGYSDTYSVTSLAPGASQQVTFAPWTQTVGDWSAMACTQLGGDLNTANDCMTQSVFVKNFDKTVYGYKGGYSGTVPTGPLSFNLNDPTVVTSIADHSALADNPYCGAWIQWQFW